MDILNNECLKKYTTVKIGGYAKKLYFPENSDELIDLLKKISTDKYYILGGGSNILMDDQKTYEHVISMNKLDPSIQNLENGRYYVGASVRLQKLINTINKDSFGGIEYLYSVPALVGGAIVMNAGRGKNYGLCISDYIENVHILDHDSINILSKEECGFKYRNSVFKDGKAIVLGATFSFDEVSVDESTRLKQERLALVKERQDNSGYNFGSVFNEKSAIIMQLIKLLHPGYKNGMAFSKKTANWLINNGEGTYEQAIKLINKVEMLHKIIGKKSVPEVRIWS